MRSSVLVRLLVFTTAIGAALLSPVNRADAKTIGLQMVISGFGSPVSAVNAGDGSGRLFVVEQTGRIKIFDGTRILATPFLDVTSKISGGGERGLLGLAFDANYETNGFFYIYYTAASTGTVTVSRYSVSTNANLANPSSEVVLKTQAHAEFNNHNGGSLLFGPDGCLYAGIGDGGSGGDPSSNGQNLGTLLGKIIRINPADGTPCGAAPGNPFVSTQGARGEIWALGLRNPWRMTFDRVTNELFIADVGQGSREEVNVQPASTGGRNYCWKRKEGTLIFDTSVACTTGTPTDPVLEYDHSAGKCSITGGYRYRGGKMPGLVGMYFYADYCSGQIWGATESDGRWTTQERLDTALNITSFVEDEAGEIYVVAGSGALYRIIPANGTHDVDGDFKSDIVWRQTSNGTVALWLMNGAQVGSTASLGAVGAQWAIAGQRDFDGNGKSDLLWRDSSGALAIWFMNGTSVASTSPVATVPNWNIVGTGDLNGDGKGDLLWRNTSGDVAVWLLNGATVTSSAALGNVPSNWTVAGHADFDGDGKADILWRDSGGAVAIWFMDGTAVVRSAVVASVASTWSIAETGDFDGDGRADLLWRDTSGNTAVWLMAGAAPSASAGYGVIPLAWSPAVTGDFTGDGKSDIVWRNSDGTISLWVMNGLEVSSTSSPVLVVPDWVIQGAGAD